MHKERDTLWHFAMSIMMYRESRHVTVLDMYAAELHFNNCKGVWRKALSDFR